MLKEIDIYRKFYLTDSEKLAIENKNREKEQNLVYSLEDIPEEFQMKKFES